MLTLLASSVHSNVGTCLQVMQHQIDLSAVQAPAAAVEYARRRAQRGTSLTALLRATGSDMRASPTGSSRSWLSRQMTPR